MSKRPTVHIRVLQEGLPHLAQAPGHPCQTQEESAANTGDQGGRVEKGILAISVLHKN